MIPVDTIWLFSALIYYFMAPHYPHPPLLYTYIAFHAKTPSLENGEVKQSRIIPESKYMNRLVTARFDIRMQPTLSILYTKIIHWTHYS